MIVVYLKMIFQIWLAKIINAIVTYFNSIDEELINDYKRRYKKN